MGYPVVITCDRTMASTYHGLLFMGFSACLPQGTLPDWLYYPMFCPPAKAGPDGSLLFANLGMRKIEASLLADGFRRDEVIVAHPDHLDRVIDSDTKIIAVTSNDPLGIGPATSTFVEILGGEGRMAVKLRQLLNSPAIRKHRPAVFLGGPGAWQLEVRPEQREALGVRCVVVGEGEITAPALFRQVLDGGLSSIPEVVHGEIAPVGRIPAIVGGTITGLIEATRGCARSCAFCVPSVRKVRSIPLDRILCEVQVNIDAGGRGALLHGEDILLYQSDGLKVNAGAVEELFDRVYHAPGVRWIGASHAALSSVVSAPGLIKRLSRNLEMGTEKHPTNYFQVGIETGSPKLIDRHMKGKVYPFPTSGWPEVVREGFRILHENHFVACSTIILGLPGEDTEDVEQTTALIRSLRSYRSIIVPLMFTPIETTRLEYSRPFLKNDLTPQHYELLTACWDHNLDWFPAIWAIYGRHSNRALKTAMNLAMKFGTPPVRHRIHRNARRHGTAV